LLISDNDNTRQVSKSYTVNTSGTWEYKTITIPADATGAFDNDNDASLYLQFWLGAGTTWTSGTLNSSSWASVTNANRAVGQTNLAAATSNYWQITGVQLEAGSVATPFEFEDIGTTLAKCQRYYYLFSTGQDKDAALGFYNSATAMILPIFFPVQMRSAPTLVAASGTGFYYALGAGGYDTFNSLTIGQRGVSSGYVQNTTEMSGTAGQAFVFGGASASSSVAFSSEL
jgi:hypothetical protein